MNKQERKYTDEQLELLSGQIQGTRYCDEVRHELDRVGKVYSDGYIIRVIGGFSYNNDIWDAAFSVAKIRKQGKVELAEELGQLVNE